MNNKSYQPPSESTPPGKRNPGSADAGKKRASLPVLTVPECDSSAEIVTFCDELLAALDCAPPGLVLRFVGPHQMPPDPALILYEILTTHRKGIVLLTEAWSPLIGPSVLVWLAGGVRRVRATTYFHFRSLREILHRKPSRLPWEEKAEWMAGDAELEVNLGATDYKTVLRLMDQYLPVDQLAGKIITPEMLRELGLVGHGPLDDLLEKYLAADAAPVAAPPISTKESADGKVETKKTHRAGPAGANQKER